MLSGNPGMPIADFDAALEHRPGPTELEQEHRELLKRWQSVSRHTRDWGEPGLQVSGFLLFKLLRTVSRHLSVQCTHPASLLVLPKTPISLC